MKALFVSQLSVFVSQCPYLELFWSVFLRIQAEYGEIRSISPHSISMPENTDQSNSEYGQFSRSVEIKKDHLDKSNYQ